MILDIDRVFSAEELGSRSKRRKRASRLAESQLLEFCRSTRSASEACRLAFQP